MLSPFDDWYMINDIGDDSTYEAEPSSGSRDKQTARRRSTPFRCTGVFLSFLPPPPLLPLPDWAVPLPDRAAGLPNWGMFDNAVN